MQVCKILNIIYQLVGLEVLRHHKKVKFVFFVILHITQNRIVRSGIEHHRVNHIHPTLVQQLKHHLVSRQVLQYFV